MTGNKKQSFLYDPLQTKKPYFWLKLISFQTIIFIVWLLVIPKEPGNAFILGYSLRRLALMVPLSLPFIGALLLKWGYNQHANWRLWLSDAQKKPKIAVFLVISGLLLSAVIWSFAFFFHFMRLFPDLGAYIRLLPILACYFLLGVEAILFVPLILFPSSQEFQKEKSRYPLSVFIIAFGVLVIGLIIVAVTGWGINPERVSIISLGSPLLEGQVWYAIGTLVLMMAAAYAWGCIPVESRPILRGKADLIIALTIWLAAVILWMSLPLPKNNYFAPPVQAPNFEIYPFSDAEQYDFNSLYVYYGSLKDIVISKPLYVTLLALLHAVAGLKYDRIILLQTLIVALFPAVLYLIGKELHSRLGGIAIALFAILREVTAIQATNMANVSSTKLLLSDISATLLVSILSLVLLRWFKNNNKTKVTGHEFIIGGLIGAFILIRIQTLALVPFALALIVVRYFRNIKSIVFSSLILLLAVGLVITPVLLRNHSITGVYWIDNPSSSAPLSRILTQGMEGVEDFNLVKGGTEVVNQNKTILGTLITKNFGFFANFTFDNFARNEISSILILPVRLGNSENLRDFLQLSKPFWAEVYSRPNLLNLLVLLFNFGLIALGFSSIFKMNPWASLVVVGLHVVYSLSSALVRLSGWRFILPVDWIFYALYALGLIEGFIWLFRNAAGWNLASKTSWLIGYLPEKEKTSRGWMVYALFGVLFLLIGSAIPLREKLLPSLTPEYSRSEVCQTIESEIMKSKYAPLSDGFSKFCMADNTRALYGFGIYPRYFKSGEGFFNRSYDPFFGKQPYARLVFRIIGTQNGKIYIKSENEAPRFPNGAKVYAVGVEKTKFEAQVVFVEGQQSELILSSEIISGQESFDSINK